MAENAWKGVVCLEFVKEKKAICASSAALTEPSARVRLISFAGEGNVRSRSPLKGAARRFASARRQLR